MDKKTRIFLILLIAFSFLLEIVLAFLTPVKYWDETIYSNLGENLVKYREYSFLHGFADFTPNWPLAGIRPPLLPFFIAFVKLFSDNLTLLNFIAPIFSTLGVLVFFFFIRKFFNEEIAVYSSIILAFFPMNIFWGSKILTDSVLVTFLIFSSYFFFETFLVSKKKSSNYSSSIFFGLFLALAFLVRYSSIWFYPVLFFTLLFKYKDVKFLIERKFWISVSTFFIVLIPWLIFNYHSYGSLFGFLSDSSEAAVRWGTKSSFFYGKTLLNYFWYLIPFIVASLFLYKKLPFDKNAKNFFIFWFLLVLLSASLTSAKENRYLLIIVPSGAVLSSLSIFYLRRLKKMYSILSLILIMLAMSISVFFLFNAALNNKNSDETKCFFSTMDFIKNSEASAVVTEHFSPVYFYTDIPNIRVNNYVVIKRIIDEEYQNKRILYYYVNGDWFNLKEETNNSLNLVYSCNKFEVFDISRN